MSVLLLTTDGDVRLRYMLAAMRYSSMARFAHVHLTGDRRVEEMREALAIPCATCDSAVIFNDFPEVGRFDDKNKIFCFRKDQSPD